MKDLALLQIVRRRRRRRRLIIPLLLIMRLLPLMDHLHFQAGEGEENKIVREGYNTKQQKKILSFDCLR